MLDALSHARIAQIKQEAHVDRCMARLRNDFMLHFRPMAMPFVKPQKIRSVRPGEKEMQLGHGIPSWRQDSVAMCCNWVGSWDGSTAAAAA